MFYLCFFIMGNKLSWRRRCEMEAKKQWLVIGISGVTCGGKTTLAQKLLTTLRPSYYFEQDRYFFPDDSPHHVKVDGIDHNNYDILSALDMPQMYTDLISTMQGTDKSHGRHTTATGVVISPGGNSETVDISRPAADPLTLPGINCLIVEGFSVLNYKPIMDLCDLRYYIVLEYGECQARRALRLYDPPDVPGYFDKCVWPGHLKYRAEMEKDSRVRFLDGMRPDSLDDVIRDLVNKGFKPSSQVNHSEPK